MGLILASASPRRRELLTMAGAGDFTVRPAAGEEPRLTGLPPAETVRQIALHKGREVAETAGPADLVLAADTLVALDGALLGKPRSRAEAADMLGRLSGNCHTVYTGVAMLLDGRELTEHEETRVYFRNLTREEIAAYVDTGEPMDKAGAYGIQGRAAVFVRRIEGDVYNVIGLPLCRVALMAREIGVSLF